MDEPLYRCWTKATEREEGSPRRSWSWVAARRGWFKIFRDRVECGDWRVPVESIRRAIVYRGRSLMLPVRVLHLETEDGTYQFGFNPWIDIERQLPFEVERQEVRFGHSALSLVLRLMLVAWLLLWLWDRFSR